MLTCRPAHHGDITTICTFPQDADELFFMFPRASYPLTPAQLQAAIAERSDSTVVELDGEVIGFANLYRWESGGVCSIGNVVIAPSFRARGVGRYLINHMIKVAFTTHAASEISISCFSPNTAGLLLYSKLGFQPISIEGYLDNNLNLVALITLRIVRSTTHSR